MADQGSDKVSKAFQDWQAAETAFAAALADFVKDGQPAKVKKSSARGLAELRGAADAKMGSYFKKAVS